MTSSLGGTAKFRGRVCASHPAVPGSNHLTAGKKSNPSLSLYLKPAVLNLFGVSALRVRIKKMTSPISGDLHPSVEGQAPGLRLPARDGGQGFSVLAQDRERCPGSEKAGHRYLQGGPESFEVKALLGTAWHCSALRRCP